MDGLVQASGVCAKGHTYRFKFFIERREARWWAKHEKCEAAEWTVIPSETKLPSK